MTWLTPLTGLLVAAAVIPPLVLLYFLKLRRRPIPVGSTLLWKKSTEDLRANAFFQRLRLSVLLFLQLLALILVALALMQPQIDLGQRRGGRSVILIDNSASMNATDDGADGRRSRLELAKEAARQRVERLFGGGLFSGSPGQVMVIAFNDRAEVRTPFTDSRVRLLEAIDGIEATDGETTIGAALELSRAFSTNIDPDAVDRPIEAPAALELYSDGRIADLGSQVLKPGETLGYTVIGRSDTPNVGIIGVAADRRYDRLGQIQVFAAIANFGREPTRCDVQLSVNGSVVAITPKPIELAAATEDPTAGFVPAREQIGFLPFEQPRGAVIEVALLVEDALVDDNVASIVVPPARRLTVALVDSEGFFFPDILTALSKTVIAEYVTLSRAEFETLAASGGLDRFDVVILDDFAPTALPAGRFFAFGATPPIVGLTDIGSHPRAFVRSTREEHPLFQSVDLRQLFVGDLRAVAAAPEAQVLVEGTTGPLVTHVTRGAVDVLHVAFNPLDSNGPFLRSFINFVCNGIEWLGTIRDAVATEGLRPGEAITARLPTNATDIRIQMPDGSDRPIVITNPESFAWGPVRRVGLYDLTWTQPGADGRQSRAFAVNLLSEQEGRLEAVEELTLGVEAFTGTRLGQGIQTPLWPWALLACAAVLMLEWWVYVRRT